MSGFTVFYSWQSDLPSNNNRTFIEKAAENAIKQINNEAVLFHSPRLDQALRGETGIPAIAETILRKIGNCGFFLADISLVGRTHNGKKSIPNPNVMFELGYAAQVVGWKRIIL
ncbi:MAG: hypothetical protein KC592_20505, partial [Nitrospira sp.]|nr:hypothetical protein [Nitrospira sp.]